MDDLQISSTVATARGESDEAEAVERVVVAYAKVGRALQEASPIPYSPKVIKPARAIASILDGAIPSIRFETPDEDATIYSPAAKPSTPSAVLMSAFGAVGGGLKP